MSIDKGTISILAHGLTVSASWYRERVERRIVVAPLQRRVPKVLRAQREGHKHGDVGYVPAAIVVRR